MGKSSKAQRLRKAQPAAPDKAWCDHCLGVLHDTGWGPIGRAVLEEYENMRSGFQNDRQYSHAEAMEWIEDDVGVILQALRSSGERYRYELDLADRAETGLIGDDWAEYVAIRLRLGEISQKQADEWLEEAS